MEGFSGQKYDLNFYTTKRINIRESNFALLTYCYDRSWAMKTKISVLNFSLHEKAFPKRRKEVQRQFSYDKNDIK